MAEFGAALLGWGLWWALLCLGLCAGRLVAAPRRLGRAAVACALHQLVLVLPPGAQWAAWLGLKLPAALVHPAYHPVVWSGKVLGLLLISGLVYGLKWVTPAEAGLRRPQPGAARVVAPVVLVAAAALFVDAYWSRHAFAALWWNERVYLALMPGLEEELFYRGALLGLLGRVFPRTVPLPQARTSWGGLVGVLLFALGHSFKFWGFTPLLSNAAQLVAHGQGWVVVRYFLAGGLLFQLAMGLLFLWVRERTGSVWAAAATHCLMNSVLVLGHALP